MKNKKQSEAVMRDHLLGILSAEESARVANAGLPVKLLEGDEFIDLMEIDRGVQRAGATNRNPVGETLARKAVHENTWLKIVTDLTARKLMAHVPTPPPRQPR